MPWQGAMIWNLIGLNPGAGKKMSIEVSIKIYPGTVAQVVERPSKVPVRGVRITSRHNVAGIKFKAAPFVATSINAEIRALFGKLK